MRQIHTAPEAHCPFDFVGCARRSGVPRSVCRSARVIYHPMVTPAVGGSDGGEVLGKAESKG